MEINLNTKAQKLKVGDVLVIKQTNEQDLLYRLIVQNLNQTEYYMIDLDDFSVANSVYGLNELYEDYNTSHYKLIDIIKSDDLELRRK